MEGLLDIDTGRRLLREGRHHEAFLCFLSLMQAEASNAAEAEAMQMFQSGLLQEEQISDLLGWLNREAERGQGFAAFNAALIFQRGTPAMPADPVRAAKFYEEAVMKEVPEAALNLGLLLLTGSESARGLAQDAARGIDLLAKATEMGSREAAYSLGSHYLKGESIARDDRKAFTYLAVAAILGHPKAKEACGLMQKMSAIDFSEQVAEAKRIEVRIHNYRAYLAALDAERR